MKLLLVAALMVLPGSMAITHGQGMDLSPGAVAELNGRKATLRTLDTLPFVESEFTRRFKFDSYDNPKLAELRERYRLDHVIAPGKDEFDRQVRLMDWARHQFKKFGKPSTNAAGALGILNAIEEGHTFFCAQYAHVMVSTAASLGWVDRELALRRHQGVAKVGGSTEHSVTEIWSNQHRKWVMLDPTSNMYLERDGLPLNAYEIRQEWFYRGGTNLVFVIGKERKRYRKPELPIVLQYFPGFGELAVHPDELDKYGFIGYIPNTDLMDRREDYAQMFITKDQLCDGTKWHVRTLPANPASDPYFSIGQAAVSLVADRGEIRVKVKTLTPNFKRYEVRMDDGDWTPPKRGARNAERGTEAEFAWALHPGTNRLGVRTINQFGVAGPVSTAVMEVVETTSAKSE